MVFATFPADAKIVSDAWYSVQAKASFMIALKCISVVSYLYFLSRLRLIGIYTSSCNQSQYCFIQFVNVTKRGFGIFLPYVNMPSKSHKLCFSDEVNKRFRQSRLKEIRVKFDFKCSIKC